MSNALATGDDSSLRTDGLEWATNTLRHQERQIELRVAFKALSANILSGDLHAIQEGEKRRDPFEVGSFAELILAAKLLEFFETTTQVLDLTSHALASRSRISIEPSLPKVLCLRAFVELALFGLSPFEALANSQMLEHGFSVGREVSAYFAVDDMEHSFGCEKSGAAFVVDITPFDIKAINGTNPILQRLVEYLMGESALPGAMSFIVHRECARRDPQPGVVTKKIRNREGITPTQCALIANWTQSGSLQIDGFAARAPRTF